MVTPVPPSSAGDGGELSGGPGKVAPPIQVIDSTKTNKANFHIIISDDNPGIAGTIGNPLATEGYTVSTFSNHQEAERALPTKPFNLLIVNQGGISLINKVKHTYPQAKVLLCTGDSFAEKGKADDILIKPFKMDALKNKVSTLLEIKE